jgi:hypothetical protein
MMKMVKLAAVAAAALGLAACEGSADENLAASAENVGAGLGNLAEDAANVTTNVASDVGNAVGNGLDSAGNSLNNTANEAESHSPGFAAPFSRPTALWLTRERDACTRNRAGSRDAP